MNILDVIEQTQGVVCRGRLRKYYRFRWATFYGGIATADCVGCCLRCIFCWAWDVVNGPETTGRCYSPEYVAKELVSIARKHHGQQMRISGNEPTLNRQHLLEVLSLIPQHYRFILETNGIPLGLDRTFCRDLALFPNIHVRVSLKGCCPVEFQRLTGMDADGFGRQVKALENLTAEGVSCHAAVMTTFSDRSELSRLACELTAIDLRLAAIEEEEVILYPSVEDRLRSAGFI
jgi:uncharacterized Fe-S cluster-containing radical SAM superfamily protein